MPGTGKGEGTEVTWSFDRIMVRGIVSMFVLVLIALVLTTSFPAHGSRLIYGIGVALLIPIGGTGILVDMAGRRSLRQSWYLPSPERVWRDFMRILWLLAIGMTAVIALQPVFGRFSLLPGLVLIIVLWGLIGGTYVYLRRSFRKSLSRSPWWYRNFATRWPDFRPRIESLAGRLGFRVEFRKVGWDFPRDSLVVLSSEGKVAEISARRNGGIVARVRPGTWDAALRLAIEDAASGIA